MKTLLIMAFLALQVLRPTGEPRILTLLLEFSDQHFTIADPVGSFDRMLNQEGYAEEGGCGSVRDWFRDNSQGQFVPTFEVKGPIRLSKTMAEYGRDVVSGGERQGDIAPELALAEACQLLDSKLDFRHYDANLDGVVDLVLYYFPSYDQAAGATSDHLWSQWGNVRNSASSWAQTVRFDGKRLGPFICTSELAGYSGSQFCGIGLTVHEMGHALGLPDLYDTDGGIGGTAGGPWQYSPMGRGCYNNNGRTPPYFTAQELLLLGWMPSSRVQPLPAGPVSVPPVQEYAAFQSLTDTEGEYFLYECRNGSGWDAPLDGGLLVLHVDRSSRRVNGVPARDLWDSWARYNTLNNDAAHPCFHAVCSWEPGMLAYSPALLPGQVVFPGLGQNYACEPVDWEGNSLGVRLTNITWEAGHPASLYVLPGSGSNLNGLVRDAAGEPVAQVLVSVDGKLSAVTGADGFFGVEMPAGPLPSLLTVSFSKEGYRTQEKAVATGEATLYSVPVTLRRTGEADEHELALYDNQSLTGYYPRPGICAVRYTPMDLIPYVGNLLTQVDVYPVVSDGYNGGAYLTVDIGMRRVLTRSLPALKAGQHRPVTVDISDAGILIPEGQDVYVGYGSTPAVGDRFRSGTLYPAEKGRSYYSPFDMNVSQWEELYHEESGYWMDVFLSTRLKELEEVQELEKLGYNYIRPAGEECHAGDRFPLKLVTTAGNEPFSQRWFYDGLSVPPGEVQLTAGRHRISVALDYGNGCKEELSLDLNVLD